MALHTETSPITLVGDKLLGMDACSNPSCIENDLSLLVLELEKEVVAGFGRGVHCKWSEGQSEFRTCNHMLLHWKWLIKRRG